MTSLEPILTLPKHPFYCGLNVEDDSDLPATLPFSLAVHPRYAIPRLVLTDEIRAVLNRAYALGSMCSTPLGESALASNRMLEFEGHLLAAVGSLTNKTVLEIGCGNGGLLNELRNHGATVTGLEIGPQADVVRQRYGIPVLAEPLRVSSPVGRFDVILSYGCLEHIEDLESFFAASRAHLNSGGLFFHCVPNAAPAFERGDLEHLHHEHVNYFSTENALALFDAQGFGNGGTAVNAAGNELMVWGWFDPGRQAFWPEQRVAREIEVLAAHVARLRATERSTLAALSEWIAAGLRIGFYAGGYVYGYALNDEGVRYFDADSYKHGKRWLPSLPPIEPPAALEANPVDRIVVCKPHYMAAITATLTALGIHPSSVVNIDDLAARC